MCSLLTFGLSKLIMRHHLLIVRNVRLSVALMYSVGGVLLAKVRGAEDELNTLAAATLTGLAYKSTGECS